MQSCLGITLSDKLIKYAKVEKDANNLKVVSFGVKFYEAQDLYATIGQIINETDSKRTPVSINTINEQYYYFNIFNLTNNDYAKKAIELEFESFCNDNHLNPRVYEGRYTKTKDLVNQDKEKVIYIYQNKLELEEKLNSFKDARVTTITPTSTSIANIMNLEKGKNILVVDLEDRTTVTTIINQQINNVDILTQGLQQTFEAIQTKENSTAKAYEVMKNTTIYTMEMQANAGMDKNMEYLQYIVPSLYKITQELQNITKNYKKIDKIYLTGYGTTINNIDLYFQEYFKDTKVEILKPFFLENTAQNNIKDYIEVNSAIALAIQGLGYGIKALNFIGTKAAFKDMKSLLSMDVKDIKGLMGAGRGSSKTKGASKFNFDFSLKGAFDNVDAGLVRNIFVILIVTIVFCVASYLLSEQIEKQKEVAQDIIDDTQQQIQLAEADDYKIKDKTQDYQRYKLNLENTSSAIETKRSRKNQITTLLNRIIYTIPKEAIITQIQNTEKTSGSSTVQHIKIDVQARAYDKLAYFVAKLKSASVLENIVSTEGSKEGDYVKISIEGDLKTY